MIYHNSYSSTNIVYRVKRRRVSWMGYKSGIQKKRNIPIVGGELGREKAT
jgi:hypothetical protein